jgi:branched-subunit amino acid aminotransferase/4-amino-4-deoxychorismate lyase
MLATNISNVIERISKPLPQILQSYPNGKYTVLRTIGSGLVDWPFHLKRLDPNKDIIPTIKRVMAEFQKEHPTCNNLKLTILTWPESNVLVHVSDFTPIPHTKPFIVRLSTDKDAPKRLSPSEKRSSWIAHRAALQHDSSYDETLISSTGKEGCEILEGLTSNIVFMGKNGVFRTSPVDRVLPGSVLHLVDAVLGDRLIYRAARLEELYAGEFVGAFLTSTSRILCPIEIIRVMEGGCVVEFDVGGYARELDVLRGEVHEEMKNRLTVL